MSVMYGTYPLTAPEIKGAFYLSNGMYCVYGNGREGLSVDIYKDKSMKKLISMQHGVVFAGGFDEELLRGLMESMVNEFDEDGE